MNFLKKVENSLEKLLGKRPQEITLEESPRYKDFGYLVYAQLFNRIHELLKTQQFSDEVINKSYAYYYDDYKDKDIKTMPLFASVLYNYGKHYGFKKENNVQWKSLLQELLLQENLRFDYVVPSDNNLYSFSLLYLLLFGGGNLIYDSFCGDEKQATKLVFALEALELLREHRIKFGAIQGFTSVTRGVDGHDNVRFESLVGRFKRQYHKNPQKRVVDSIIECLVDLGVDMDICYIQDHYYSEEYLARRIQNTHRINDSMWGEDLLETEFKDVVKKIIAIKQSKSLGVLVQHARQQPLMNIFFGFC